MQRKILAALDAALIAALIGGFVLVAQWERRAPDQPPAAVADAWPRQEPDLEPTSPRECNAGVTTDCVYE